MAKVVLVTIGWGGRMPLIGGDGPILVPTRMSFDLVKKLVMNGVKVNLHNQNDVHQKVRLTRTNLDEKHFPPVVPKPQPKPVGKEIPQISFEKKVEKPVVETASEETKEVTSEIRTLIQNEESTKETPKEEVNQVSHPTVAAMPTADPYAGMSKNQRKRARQAEAAARAAAAAASHTNEENDSQ